MGGVVAARGWKRTKGDPMEIQKCSCEGSELLSAYTLSLRPSGHYIPVIARIGGKVEKRLDWAEVPWWWLEVGLVVRNVE